VNFFVGNLRRRTCLIVRENRRERAEAVKLPIKTPRFPLKIILLDPFLRIQSLILIISLTNLYSTDTTVVQVHSCIFWIDSFVEMKIMKYNESNPATMFVDHPT